MDFLLYQKVAVMEDLLLSLYSSNLELHKKVDSMKPIDKKKKKQMKNNSDNLQKKSNMRKELNIMDLDLSSLNNTSKKKGVKSLIRSPRSNKDKERKKLENALDTVSEDKKKKETSPKRKKKHDNDNEDISVRRKKINESSRRSRRKSASLERIRRTTTKETSWYNLSKDFEDELKQSDDIFLQAWQELENQKQRRITSLGPKDLEKLIFLARSDLNMDDTLEDSESSNKFTVSKKYRGPSFETVKDIDTNFLSELIDYFNKGKTLHYKYSYQIIEEATEIFIEEPNVIEFDIPTLGKLVVVGDLHGQMLDLLTIFRKVGIPSKSMYYIFNGDFVDRGPQGIEIILILYTLKIMYPKYVILHRGNHEERRINKRYNFEGECRAKYDAEMFDFIEDSFITLPLCSVFNSKVFVVHGGLPAEDATIHDITLINRKIEMPKHSKINNRELKIFEALLWSDPKDIEVEPYWEESHRGCGVAWGEPITSSFLERNHLDLIVRSHQLVQEGHTCTHQNKVITVFSASYYCGINDNKCAIAMFEHEQPTVAHFKTFTAEVRTKDHQFNRKTETLKKLRNRIYKKRHKLWNKFLDYDTDRDGEITKSQWRKSMDDVLNLPIEWKKIMPYLVRIDENGRIKYLKFLDRYQLKIDPDLEYSWEQSVSRLFCEKIKEDLDLKETFSRYVNEDSNRIPLKDFVEILQELNLGLTNNMLYDFARKVDGKGTGITYSKFKKYFELQFKRISMARDLPWIRQELGKIIFRSSEMGIDTKEDFKQFLSKRSSKMTFKRFEKYLGTLGLETSYSDLQKHKIFSYLDKSANNSVDWESLETLFSDTEFPAVDLEEAVENIPLEGSNYISELVWHALYTCISNLREIFRALDLEGSGTLPPRAIAAGISAVSPKMATQISEEQIEILVDSLPLNEDGLINFEFFLEQFEVVDIHDNIE
eukprot:TRINITY_DN6518_c0_g1_i1.p1 TRINITY_DN6518_c0_g1~~TRINITY_DN6518_c0_g1_i1.p1  ORF type:complete len:939 (-),score=223.33 TRINITY_DN6518_c0_g1_i1:63-2879(-)